MPILCCKCLLPADVANCCCCQLLLLNVLANFCCQCSATCLCPSPLPIPVASVVLQVFVLPAAVVVTNRCRQFMLCLHVVSIVLQASVASFRSQLLLPIPFVSRCCGLRMPTLVADCCCQFLSPALLRGLHCKCLLLAAVVITRCGFQSMLPVHAASFLLQVSVASFCCRLLLPTRFASCCGQFLLLPVFCSQLLC